MSADEYQISMAGGDGDPLDAIQRRADAATPGPWISERHDLTLYVANTTGELDPINLGYVGNRPERNAEFIAHARTDVPDLLALVREQAAKLEAATQLIADLADPGVCEFDHHGGCQAHGYLSLEPGETCPQYDAKVWTP